MKKIISLLYSDKKLFAQFTLVFAAFFVMVLIGSVFGSRIVSKNVASYGTEVISSAAKTLTSYINELTVTLEDIAFVITNLKKEGAELDTFAEEITAWTNWMNGNDEKFDVFLGVYGIIDDQYVDGTGWKPLDDYVPQSRPWYTGALAQNGEICLSNPYIDAQTGEIVFTASKMVFDINKKPFGVIAIDVFISSLSEYVSELSILKSGYGMLLDANRMIIAHPDASIIGMRMEEVNSGAGGYAEISAALALGQEVQAFSYNAYNGVKSVAFFTKLINGWYVGIVSPKTIYYSDVYTMVAILSIAGLVLMLALCAILAYLHMEKKRSDEANKIKSSFLANMSHEIRTPMNAIVGMSELLLNESLSERQRGYVSDINVSSHSLLSIVNDILDLSKIESGKMELNPVHYDFLIFIDTLHSMFMFVAMKKGLDFQFEKENDLPKCLFGDDIRLRQILTNICGNAVKFTQQGFIQMKVTADDQTITFEIKDTGMGIRKEDLPTLFDTFTQADLQRNRSIIGTGLGLSISKSFVEMMGGKIAVDSVYGQGTTFTITIPKVIGEESEIRYKDKEKKAELFYAPTATILVVDDNELNLKVAKGLIGIHEITVVTALSGQEAVRMVQEQDFDIVFMDHMMPEMDGVETVQKIRKLGGPYKKLIIVALTANAVRGAKEMFMENGFNGFISKPIDVGELNEILRGLLPPEKLVKQSKKQAEMKLEKAEEITANGFLDSLKNIGSINVEVGMSRFSGVEDMYQETVELLCRKLMSEGEKMAQLLSDGDLRNFAISVHGMKSSLATIGAMNLSETAFELEKASRGENQGYCEERFPGFFAGLRTLQEQLEAVIGGAAGASDLVDGFLQENVQAALAAADDFESDLAVTFINKLLERGFGPQTDTLLEDAKNALEDFDFDTAIDLLNEIL